MLDADPVEVFCHLNRRLVHVNAHSDPIRQLRLDAIQQGTESAPDVQYALACDESDDLPVLEACDLPVETLQSPVAVLYIHRFIARC